MTTVHWWPVFKIYSVYLCEAKVSWYKLDQMRISHKKRTSIRVVPLLHRINNCQSWMTICWKIYLLSKQTWWKTNWKEIISQQIFRQNSQFVNMVSFVRLTTVKNCSVAQIIPSSQNKNTGLQHTGLQHAYSWSLSMHCQFDNESLDKISCHWHYY